jgi:putative endonuclease
VVGRIGEEAAARLYLGRGYEIVARNWRCPLGEIDLVVRRGGLLVFCEVKSRSGAGFGGGHEAVTWRKQRKLRQLAEAFLGTAGSRWRPSGIRFDVASVAMRPGGDPREPGPGAIQLFEDAF